MRLQFVGVVLNEVPVMEIKGPAEVQVEVEEVQEGLLAENQVKIPQDQKAALKLREATHAKRSPMILMDTVTPKN